MAEDGLQAVETFETAALRDELEKAVISLDREEMRRIIRQISGQNASLGSTLTHLAGKLAYTPILRAIQSGKTKFTETSA